MHRRRGPATVQFAAIQTLPPRLTVSGVEGYGPISPVPDWGQGLWRAGHCGVSDAKKRFVYPKSISNSGLFSEFQFMFLRRNFLRWVGGWAGRSWAGPQMPLPPPPSLPRCLVKDVEQLGHRNTFSMLRCVRAPLRKAYKCREASTVRPSAAPTHIGIGRRCANLPTFVGEPRS